MKIFSGSKLKNTVLIGIGIYGLSNGVAFSAHESQQSYEYLFAMPMEALLQVPITSATLTEKDHKTVPSSVTVFGQDQIRNLGVDYLHELVNFVPGFQSYRQGENSVQYYHSARGHRSSTTSREVLVLIDGVRMNREFDNVFATPMLSLHNVEKVEFIRGPGSALYGSNAVLGVIDITTRKMGNQAQLIAGDPSRKQFNVMAGFETGNWQGQLALNGFDESGEPLKLQNYNTLQQEEGRDPRNGEDIQLYVRFDKTMFSAMMFNREAEDYYVSERTSSNINYTQHKHGHVRFEQGVDWSKSFVSEFSVVYSDNEFDPKIDFGPFSVADALQEEDNVDVKLHNQWSYHESHSLEFGLDYRYSDMKAFNLVTSTSTTYELYPDATRKNSGLYIQSQNSFVTGTDVIFGARYDHYNNIGSSISPRLGVVQSITQQQTVKFLYGEAFRAPTINELMLRDFSGGVVGNPDLKPETIDTWELIWIGQWEKQSVTINGFYNEIESVIFRDETLPSSNFENKAEDEAFYGVEAEYSVQINKNWQLNANGSYFRNLPDSDFRQSEKLASFIVNYHRDHWNLNISATYAGVRKMQIQTDTVPISDYWLVNGKWQYAFSQNISVFLQAKNLLDEEYETPPQRNRHTDPLPNRGRETSIGLSVNFD